MALPETRSFSFDSPIYEEIRLEGVQAYSRLYEGLSQAEGNGSTDKERPEWDAARRRALRSLRPPHRQIPMRTLALLGGNVTWGALETFYHQPQDPDGRPASQELREWYARYSGDFDLFFPEHREQTLPGPGVWDDTHLTGLKAHLQRVGSIFVDVNTPTRPLDSAVALGILLRDFAEPLAPMARALGFSLDELTRYLLSGMAEGGPTEPVYDFYQGVLEQLRPGPAAMFVAFAMTDEVPIAGRWSPVALFAAAGDEAQRPKRRDPDRIVKKHANSDLPTVEDHLGVEPLVHGLRALLDDERTDPCLSIGITAPWGGGKSSAMFQLRRALVGSHGERHRTWIPIRFDAWKFERSERIWAALARAIYEQGQEGMSAWEKAAFRFRLERRRHGWLKVLGGPLFVLVVLLVAGILLLVNSSLLFGGASLVLFLIGLGGVTTWVWGLLSNPFKRALDGYTSNPRYEEQLGFTTEADTDIRHLTEVLTRKPNHVLVVFVDDLDRCSPRHLVETVEAINQIFNAADHPDESAAGPGPAPCVFIIGMDREMVAAGIEVDYVEAIERLPKPRQKNFGLQFLAKIVQLSVAVPRPEAAAIERLLDSIGTEPGDGEASLRLRSSRDPSAGSVLEPESEEEAPAESRLVNPLDWMTPSQSEEDAVPFDEDSAEFQDAEREAVRFLAPNPRDVKRFDNAFRLQLHVAARTPGCKLVFDSDDLTALAKWVAMRLRWPDLAGLVDADEDLLEELENFSNSGRDVHLEGMDEQQQEWAKDVELQTLLKEDNPARRIARLRSQQFLQIS